MPLFRNRFFLAASATLVAGAMVLLFTVWRSDGPSRAVHPGDAPVAGHTVITEPLFRDASLSQGERLHHVIAEARQVPYSVTRDWIAGIPAYTLPTRQQEEDLVVFNEVLTAYRNDKSRRDPCVDFLLALLDDERLNEVVRDYAAQHLILSVQPEAERNPEIIARLLASISNPELQRTSVPGTIVNAISGFADKGVHLSQQQSERLRTATLELLSSPKTSLPLRVSLIHSVATHRNPSQYSVIRELAEQGNDLPEAVAMAAYAALAEVGGEDDLPLLAEASQARGFHSEAARSAYQKLKSQLSTP